MQKRFTQRLATAILLLGLAGSFPLLALDEPQTATLADPGSSTQSAEEQALRKRVSERWDAVLKMDFDRVYTFASPAYRQVHTKAHFFNQYGGQIKRNRIEILRVQFVDADTGKPAPAGVTTDKAIVHLNVYYNLVPDFGDPFETTSYNKEAWVKVDGEWWRVEPH